MKSKPEYSIIRVDNPMDLTKLYILYAIPVNGLHLLQTISSLPNYMAMGVLDNTTDELIAFTDGYSLTDTTYKLGNTYKGRASSILMYKLFKAFEKLIQKAGYTTWISTSTEEAGKMITRMGAKRWQQH